MSSWVSTGDPQPAGAGPLIAVAVAGGAAVAAAAGGLAPGGMTMEAAGVRSPVRAAGAMAGGATAPGGSEMIVLAGSGLGVYPATAVS